MAYTLNAIGTAYLDIGTPTEDGWRESTMWFVFCGMPIIPLKRRVVRPIKQVDTVLGYSTTLEIAETTLPRAVRVLVTYLLYWCVHLPLAVGPIVFVFSKIFNLKSKGLEGSFWYEYDVAIWVAAILWIGIYALIVGLWSEKRMKPVEVPKLDQ